MYNFPDWITEEMKENFASMWKCFNRTPTDYFDDSLTGLNGKKCIASKLMGYEYTVGIYFHKWNNIGWILQEDGKIEHVCNAKLNSRELYWLTEAKI